MDLNSFRGHWALVTGASAGIGREFALQLAAAGMNIVLVARRADRLAEIAAALRGSSGIETFVLPMDLAERGAAGRIRSATSARGLTIRLLCNNAAFGRWGRFEQRSSADYEDMVQVNVAAAIALCQEFFEDLKTFPSSAVINVSSAAAFQPVPYMAAYAATKAMLLNFSQALHGEWQKHGIVVQGLVPGPTDTEFDSIAGAYESALTTRGPAADVVKDSLRSLARQEPVALSARGTYKQRVFSGLFPSRLVVRAIEKRFRPPS
jgi:short-subunit dehydrogenase